MSFRRNPDDIASHRENDKVPAIDRGLKRFNFRLLIMPWYSILAAVVSTSYPLRIAEVKLHPLLRAFLLSLALHFVVFSTIELGAAAGLWKTRAVPKWMIEEAKRQQLTPEQLKKAQQKEQEEPPLLFVDVDASQATEEAPKDSKYYAVVNTKAANAEKKADSLTPNIQGKQDKVPKVAESPKLNPQPLQPTPRRVEPKPVEQPKPEVKPEPVQPLPKADPGETLMARANPKPQTPEQVKPAEPEVKQRPRTLADARRQKGLIDGEKLKQEGGIGRIAMDGVDARATPFGAYDAAFIAAVQARWYNLMEDRDFVRNQAGKVALEFRLHKDGRITDMNVAESEVSDTLAWMCQRAVLDPAPYAPFPSDLRRMLKTDYRDVRFTFYYEH